MTGPPAFARGVAIVGCGMIGRSWAIAFARAGWRVTLHDAVEGVAEAAIADIRGQMLALEARGLSDVGSGARAAIDCAAELRRAVAGADHVQENIAEDACAKRAILGAIDAAAPPEATVGSSTSALLPSAIMAGLPGEGRCFVAHPLNPPHLVPAVELVPAPRTDPAKLAVGAAIMREIGQRPIVLAREIPGFLMNRLQGALLDEAFRMIEEGYVDPGDIDAALKDGLALRWSFMGPLETIDLNAPGGLRDFVARYGAAYAEIRAGRLASAGWSEALVAALERARRDAVPAERLAARRAWRDDRLLALAVHKRAAAEELGE